MLSLKSDRVCHRWLFARQTSASSPRFPTPCADATLPQNLAPLWITSAAAWLLTWNCSVRSSSEVSTGVNVFQTGTAAAAMLNMRPKYPDGLPRTLTPSQGRKRGTNPRFPNARLRHPCFRFCAFGGTLREIRKFEVPSPTLVSTANFWEIPHP